MKMKKLLTSIAILFILFCTNAQEITTVILVRHAEKQVSESKNPDLTEIGRKRAQNLTSLLREIQIDHIYSTEYLRTQNTVQPISTDREIPIQPYNPRELDSFADKLLADHKGKTILVSGHSNTTPMLVNALMGEAAYENLDDSEYDWIFIVDLIEKGNGRVKKLQVTVD